MSLESRTLNTGWYKIRCLHTKPKKKKKKLVYNPNFGYPILKKQKQKRG